MCFVQTRKGKQAPGYVESDEIREVTTIRQSCSQTQWKGLNIKSGIAVNVDVFNRIFFYAFSEGSVGLQRRFEKITSQQEGFILIYIVLKHILIVFKIHTCFVLDRNSQTFVFNVGTLYCRVITCFGVIL